LIRFVGQFKNLAQRRFWSIGGQGTIWQRSFWDHFLRSTDDLAVVVAYILNNPVRAGLVQEWRDYPFAGSFELNLRNI
jgi:REP element-mobilizing transposase RayT